MRLSRATSILLAVAAIGVIARAPASVSAAQTARAAQAPADCDARRAVYRRDAIRVFLRGETIRTYYLCSDRIRRPRAYHRRRIDPAEDEPSDFGLRGRRLLYTDFIVATQTTVLAWVDLATAQYREVKVPRDVEYDEIRAVGRDGGIAFVTTEVGAGQRIWYAAPGRRALARPRVVARAPDGDIEPGSLAIVAGTVRWKTPYGPARRAPLRGAPRTVPAARLACESAQRIYRSGAVRIFMRTVGNIERFYLCSARLRRPRLFLEKNPWSYPPIYGFRRFTQRLLFWIDWGGEEDTRGLGWVDLRTAQQRDTTVPAELDIDEAAIGADGAIAVRAGDELHYARPGRRSLHALRPLARITSGTPVRRSLAVRGGYVTWRTTAGDVGRVPVPRAR